MSTPQHVIFGTGAIGLAVLDALQLRGKTARLVYQHAGQPRTKLRAMPPLMLRALGLFNPTVRELTEMQYQFEEPFIVDSSKIANKLDVHATPIGQALADTLATYRG
jgi:hypothetical protein